ncbi:hypothetical protein COLO4_18003 [Corchorus olitorius]|uniref:Uncharacterized protein n=1 Tax=Corchorus olitorius TaxID=93759 RepID=A0A1R3JAS6_9ROSI|nr:hypothetical protein COLO4_18003 [Corchorus olitorius]
MSKVRSFQKSPLTATLLPQKKVEEPMADWAQLPPELLTLIAKRLEIRSDVLRFRSICTSWRFISQPKIYPIPRNLPLKAEGRCEYDLDNIVRNTFFLVRLPGTGTHKNRTDPGRCWLLKIKDGSTDGVGVRLLRPFSHTELKSLPENFPKVLDLTKFQVIELGHEFFGLYKIYVDHPIEPQYREYTRKVALMWPNSSNSDDFIILALFRFFVEYLAFMRSGEKQWTLIRNVRDVQDFTCFNNKFYAIEQEGRTIVVDQFLNVSFLENVGSPTGKRFLVESGDDLLAVEMAFHTVFCNNSLADKVNGFSIYRLNEEEQKWVEMGNLGDRIVLISSGQAISLSCSELCLDRGNLIIYSAGPYVNLRQCLPENEDEEVTLVFDLGTKTASPLESFPSIRNLFWPPPDWLTSRECEASHSGVSSAELAISATPEVEGKHPDDSNGGKSPERGTSAEQVVKTKRSLSSKLMFKCFGS